MIRIVLYLMVFSCAVNEITVCQPVALPPVRIMFYNVENAFDIYDDTLKDDDDFLPGGLMRWNHTRFDKKINSLYKVIIAAGEWSPPEIVAFCEMENRKVLEELVFDTYMSKYNYEIVHEDSPDRRGIDVCLIYRKDIIRVLDYKYWKPAEQEFNSRSVLYVKAETNNDTLHLIVNHWPSRIGGVLAAKDLRSQIALMVKRKADSIYINKGSKIILMGDFNSTPEDPEMKMLTGLGSKNNSLINLSCINTSEGAGTYKYMGTWEMIDQILVSQKLLSLNAGFHTDKEHFRIFNPAFLLIKDPKYPGSMPFSTYRGYRYQGGYSDHLPVILELHQVSTDQQE
jgi:endonuclease/exonuclease/phosphatase family metal-dependent hydrolase